MSLRPIGSAVFELSSHRHTDRYTSYYFRVQICMISLFGGNECSILKKIALFFSTDSYIILFLEIFVLDSYPHEYFQEYSYVSILRLSINYVRKPAQIFPRIWLCISVQAFHKLCQESSTNISKNRVMYQCSDFP